MSTTCLSHTLASSGCAECKFHCTNGNCLRLGSLICNQLNNCGDNSDEENCPVVTQHPPPGIFNCEYRRMLSSPNSHALTLDILCLFYSSSANCFRMMHDKPVWSFCDHTHLDFYNSHNHNQ